MYQYVNGLSQETSSPEWMNMETVSCMNICPKGQTIALKKEFIKCLLQVCTDTVEEVPDCVLDKLQHIKNVVKCPLQVFVDELEAKGYATSKNVDE